MLVDLSRLTPTLRVSFGSGGAFTEDGAPSELFLRQLLEREPLQELQIRVQFVPPRDDGDRWVRSDLKKERSRVRQKLALIISKYKKMFSCCRHIAGLVWYIGLCWKRAGHIRWFRIGRDQVAHHVELTPQLGRCCFLPARLNLDMAHFDPRVRDLESGPGPE